MSGGSESSATDSPSTTAPGDASGATSRAVRAAGWIITGLGGILLILVIGYALVAMTIVMGEPGSHAAQDVGMLAVVLVPAAIGGLASLAVGWRVRRGGPTGRLAGLAWVVVMGGVCFVAASGEMNLLSAVRVLLAGGSVTVEPGWIVMTMPGEAGYYGYFSDPAFWTAGLVGVATVSVLVLLVVGREARPRP